MFCIFVFSNLFRLDFMERTKFTKIVDRRPLVDKDAPDLDNPHFIEKWRNKAFDRPFMIEKEQSAHGGRLFKTDFARQVYFLAKKGYEMQEIADFFGVTRSTVDQWKKTNLDFAEAYFEGRDMADFAIVEATHKNAHGYSYEEKEVAEHLDRYGNVVTLTKTTTKHRPPDTTAQIFWLKNREKEKWGNSDRSEIMVETMKMDLKVLTPDEQRMIRSITLKKISSVHGNAQ